MKRGHKAVKRLTQTRSLLAEANLENHSSILGWGQSVLIFGLFITLSDTSYLSSYLLGHPNKPTDFKSQDQHKLWDKFKFSSSLNSWWLNSLYSFIFGDQTQKCLTHYSASDIHNEKEKTSRNLLFPLVAIVHNYKTLFSINNQDLQKILPSIKRKKVFYS